MTPLFLSTRCIDGLFEASDYGVFRARSTDASNEGEEEPFPREGEKKMMAAGKRLSQRLPKGLHGVDSERTSRERADRKGGESKTRLRLC